MSYNYQTLKDSMREIIRLKITGYSNVEIAEMLEITPQTVSNKVNSDLGQRALALLHMQRDGEAVEMGERIRATAEHAMGIIEAVIAGDPSVPVDGKTRLDAAFKALGLGGYTAVKRISIDDNSRAVEAGLLQRMQSGRVAEAEAEDAQLVEEVAC